MIGRFSKFYHTGTHKGEYVLNFEGVLWCQALPPLEEYGPKGKRVLLQGTPPLGRNAQELEVVGHTCVGNFLHVHVACVGIFLHVNVA